MTLKIIFMIVLVSTFFLCACSFHRPASVNPVPVNYFVPAACKPSLRLIDCDHASPPNCKRIAATYARNCEELSAR
jgi:hypothetical protein